MTTATLTAEPGRRITFTGFASTPTPRPGVITAIDGDALLIRLDGHRFNLRITPDLLPPTKHLHLLDEIGPVPALPMGRFTPVPDDCAGIWEHDGTPYVTVGEEGENVLVITGDRNTAIAVMTGHFTDMDIDLKYVDFDSMQGLWAVFEWQPEDADSPWLWSEAKQGDDLAVHAYYLPA